MICKWNEKTNITFEVHSVTKPEVNDEITTKFYVNDFIKNIKDSKKRYWCTVFDDIDLEEGDRVKLLDFDCLVTSMNPKDKKLMQFIKVVVEVIKKGTDLEKERQKLENPYEGMDDD